MSDQLKRLRQRAKKLRLSGDLLNAKIAYLNILKILPDDMAAQTDLGDIHMQLEDFTAASRVYARIIEKHPKNPVVQANLGGALLRLGKVAEARTVLEYALELDPQSIFARINLGGVLQSQGELRLALENALEAVSIDPTHPLAFNNMGSAFSDLAMFNEAKHAYETAAMLDPSSVDALINLAFSESKLGNCQGAIDSYEQVLAMLPPEAALRADAVRFFASFEYLSLGNFEKGWEYYEGGFSPMAPLSAARSPDRRFTVPKWSGEALLGKTLMVWGEQGVGDELNFGTVLPELLGLDGNIIVEVDSRLVPIFQRSFPAFKVRSSQFDSETKKPHLEDYDQHIPFASLFKFYRKNIHQFSESGDFLIPNPDLTEEFRSRLAKKSGDFLIGVCWRSGLLSPTRNTGYFKIEEFAPLFHLKGLRIVNLQYGFLEEEIKNVEDLFGVTIERWPDIDYKNDLDKVFSIIDCLDLVVSVNSTPYAMAGSIGKLTFIPGKDTSWESFGQRGYEKPTPLFKSVYKFDNDVTHNTKSALFAIAEKIKCLKLQSTQND